LIATGRQKLSKQLLVPGTALTVEPVSDGPVYESKIDKNASVSAKGTFLATLSGVFGANTMLEVSVSDVAVVRSSDAQIDWLGVYRSVKAISEPLESHSCFVQSVRLATDAFVPANSSRLLKGAHRDHQGTAAGALATARSLGMMLGVAIAGAIYSSSLPVSGGKAAEISATHAGMVLVLMIAAATLAIGRISERPGSVRREVEAADPVNSITINVAPNREFS
jgi:hypothetical protein